MTIDSAENLYLTDTNNQRIRKIDTSGNVTTIAGDGTYGYLDGQDIQAQFADPFGITIDLSGNLYIADSINQRIRKIDTSGNVTTILHLTNPNGSRPVNILYDNFSNELYISIMVGMGASSLIKKISLSSGSSPSWVNSGNIFGSTGATGTEGPYTPSAPSLWVSPAPTTFSQAIDRLASAVYGLLSNTAIP
jgi:hypothetical protein